MSTKVYYISATKLKERTPLSMNIEDNLLTMNIYNSQEIYIQPILGTDLYRKINSDIAIGITGDYKTLLDDYVIPALEQYAVAESLLYLRYKLLNKGVQEQNSDNSVPVDSADVKYITQEIKNRAKFYSQRLTDYLVANTAKYPEYLANDNLDDMLPTGTAYFSGIQLDDIDYSGRLMGYNTGIVDLT